MLYNTGGILLSDIQKIVLTNLKCFYLRVRSCRALVQDVAEALKPAKSILLSGIRNTLAKTELVGLLERINEIVDDVHCPNTSSMTQMQLCNCVKPEVNAFLDASRNRFNQLSEDLQQQREAFEQPDQLPPARLAHSKPYGWHLSFKRAALCAGSGDVGTGKRRKLAASTSELYSGTLKLVIFSNSNSFKKRVCCWTTAGPAS